MNVDGDMLMVAVMERCSVMSSEGKIESEGMLMKGMEWQISATSPLPSVREGIWWKDFGWFEFGLLYAS